MHTTGTALRDVTAQLLLLLSAGSQAHLRALKLNSGKMHGVERGQIPDICHCPSFLSPDLPSGSLCLTASESTGANQLSQRALSISSWSSPLGEGRCGAWTSSERPLGSLTRGRRQRAACSATVAGRQAVPSPTHTASTTSVMGSPTRESQTRLQLFSKPARGCRKETGSCVRQAQSQLPPGVGSDAVSAG